MSTRPARRAPVMSTGGASAELPARTAGAPGFQRDVVDELRGIKTDKHAAGAAPVGEVVVAVHAWLEDAKSGFR